MPVPKLMRAMQDERGRGGGGVCGGVCERGGEEEKDKFYGEALPEYMEAGTLIARKLQVSSSCWLAVQWRAILVHARLGCRTGGRAR